MKYLIDTNGERQTPEIGEDYRIYRRAVSKYIAEHPSLGNGLYSVQETRDNLRREHFIRLLKNGWNPYMIVEDVFKANGAMIRRFIGRLFPERTLEEVIKEIIFKILEISK